MKYGSVCSGVEAASLAWEPLGWQPLWFSEAAPFPSAVLAHRWPLIPNLGDMTSLEARIKNGEVDAPDVLVGGTPCQAFSVAGLRNSLNDARGNLTLILVRILDEIDRRRKRRGLSPCILVWENVPGVLNTKDNAFGSFLGALAGESSSLEPAGKKWTNAGTVFGEQREIAWRTFDAQYFGVPQRRRRVFLVASAGAVSPTEILFERQSQKRNINPSRNTEKNATAFVESGFGAYRRDSVGGTLKASGGSCQGGSETLVVHGQPDGDRHAVTIPPMRVRRLTPLECERLQGMPDNHTRIPWRGKAERDCPDGPRYKAVGNSMAVPVMRWIGQRIKGKCHESIGK